MKNNAENIQYLDIRFHLGTQCFTTQSQGGEFCSAGGAFNAASAVPFSPFGSVINNDEHPDVGLGDIRQ
jgi:hypothetical protein